MRRLLIVDLEATCWERTEHERERMETIEIGALIVERPESEKPLEFRAFVRPTREPALSDFCTRLTGITQAEVDTAEGFPAAFASFVAWIGEPRAVRFASWGEYDKFQLQRDCAAHGVAYPFADDHLNLKRACCARLGIRPCGVLRALEVAGLTLEGSHHRALDDARNIWRIARIAAGAELGAWFG